MNYPKSAVAGASCAASRRGRSSRPTAGRAGHSGGNAAVPLAGGPGARWRAGGGVAGWRALWRGRVDGNVDAGGRWAALLDEVLQPVGDLLIGNLSGRAPVVERPISDVTGVGLLGACGPATNDQVPNIFCSKWCHRAAMMPAMNRFVASAETQLRAAASFNNPLDRMTRNAVSRVFQVGLRWRALCHRLTLR